MLRHRGNRDCYYLGPDGCEIHDTKPSRCKEMDCRNIAARVTEEQAIRFSVTGVLSMEVWERGRELSASDGDT